MHDFGHTRPFTFGLPLLVAVVCALSSLGWGACNTFPSGYHICNSNGNDLRCSGLTLPSNLGDCASSCSGLNAGCGSNRYLAGCEYTGNAQCSRYDSWVQRQYRSVCCDSKCEADSLSSGGIILECQYDITRGEYYRWVCPSHMTNCNSCSQVFYSDQSVCLQAQCLEDGKHWVNGECKDACNDHVELPDKCEELWRSGYNVDSDGNPGGGGYWSIVTYECYYDSCAMSLNCQEKSSFPAGSLNCSDFQDTSGTPGRCVGEIGYLCVMQCGSTTITCECDGNCQKALTNPACNCPESSSSPASSSSGGSSSSSPGSSSVEPGSSSVEPGSSAVDPGSSGSGSGSDWEYNYNPQFNQLVSLNTSQVGYLSDIDKQIAQLNAMGLKVDNSAVVAAVTEGTAAQTAGNDTLHSLHGTLDHIDSVLNTEVETPDVTDWLSSASNLVDNLYSKANDTASTIIGIDSLKADTSSFKSKYSSLFISGAYTRDGCYEFEIKESGFLGRVGRQFKLGAKVDFSSIGGFDLCSILRGVVRAFGAILCLLITIKAYRSAFSSSDG